MSGVPITASTAHKHGVGEADILHAYRNPVRVWDLGEGFTMIVGASTGGTLLEIGYVEGAEAVVIVHATRARKKFMR